MSQSKNPAKQYLLLDTCIIQYSASKDIGDPLAKYLTGVKNRGFEFAISAISIYELLQGISATKESEFLSQLESANTFQLDNNNLIAAAQIRTLYDMEKLPSTQISDGDKIIAAASVLTGSGIITANYNDFPRPFFVEMERQWITYPYKNTERSILIYMLAPDFTTINLKFSQRPKS